MSNPFIDKLASLGDLQPSEIGDRNFLMADPREYSAK